MKGKGGLILLTNQISALDHRGGEGTIDAKFSEAYSGGVLAVSRRVRTWVDTCRGTKSGKPRGKKSNDPNPWV